MVYFIRSPSTGLIKIGRTRFLVSRLADLEYQEGETLEVLGVLPQALDSKEYELHRAFQELRHHGEWFTPAEVLLEFIERHAVRWAVAHDETPGNSVFVRIDRAVWHRAKRLAKEEGVEIGDWITARLRPLVEHAAY